MGSTERTATVECSAAPSVSRCSSTEAEEDRNGETLHNNNMLEAYIRAAVDSALHKLILMLEHDEQFSNCCLDRASTGHRSSSGQANSSSMVSICADHLTSILHEHFSQVNERLFKEVAETHRLPVETVDPVELRRCHRSTSPIRQCVSPSDNPMSEEEAREELLRILEQVAREGELERSRECLAQTEKVVESAKMIHAQMQEQYTREENDLTNPHPFSSSPSSSLLYFVSLQRTVSSLFSGVQHLLGFVDGSLESLDALQHDVQRQSTDKNRCHDEVSNDHAKKSSVETDRSERVAREERSKLHDLLSRLEEAERWTNRLMDELELGFITQSQHAKQMEETQKRYQLALQDKENTLLTWQKFMSVNEDNKSVLHSSSAALSNTRPPHCGSSVVLLEAEEVDPLLKVKRSSPFSGCLSGGVLGASTLFPSALVNEKNSIPVTAAPVDSSPIVKHNDPAVLEVALPTVTSAPIEVNERETLEKAMNDFLKWQQRVLDYHLSVFQASPRSSLNEDAVVLGSPTFDVFEEKLGLWASAVTNQCSVWNTETAQRYLMEIEACEQRCAADTELAVSNSQVRCDTIKKAYQERLEQHQKQADEHIQRDRLEVLTWKEENMLLKSEMWYGSAYGRKLEWLLNFGFLPTLKVMKQSIRTWRENTKANVEQTAIGVQCDLIHASIQEISNSVKERDALKEKGRQVEAKLNAMSKEKDELVAELDKVRAEAHESYAFHVFLVEHFSSLVRRNEALKKNVVAVSNEVDSSSANRTTDQDDCSGVLHQEPVLRKEKGNEKRMRKIRSQVLSALPKNIEDIDTNGKGEKCWTNTETLPASSKRMGHKTFSSEDSLLRDGCDDGNAILAGCRQICTTGDDTEINSLIPQWKALFTLTEQQRLFQNEHLVRLQIVLEEEQARHEQVERWIFEVMKAESNTEEIMMSASFDGTEKLSSKHSSIRTSPLVWRACEPTTSSSSTYSPGGYVKLMCDWHQTRSKLRDKIADDEALYQKNIDKDMILKEWQMRYEKQLKENAGREETWFKECQRLERLNRKLHERCVEKEKIITSSPSSMMSSTIS